MVEHKSTNWSQLSQRHTTEEARFELKKIKMQLTWCRAVAWLHTACRSPPREEQTKKTQLEPDFQQDSLLDPSRSSITTDSDTKLNLSAPTFSSVFPAIAFFPHFFQSSSSPRSHHCHTLRDRLIFLARSKSTSDLSAILDLRSHVHPKPILFFLNLSDRRLFRIDPATSPAASLVVKTLPQTQPHPHMSPSARRYSTT